MLDFKSLETFVWVATLGSFRGAAAKLNTTQPAISQRIAQLEDEFGIRLLERTSRTVSPTEKGRELLVHAEKMLQLRTEMRLAIAEKNAVRGLLRLGVSETIINTWLPDLLQKVAEAHPQLNLEINVDISPVLRDKLVAQEIDLAFLLGPVSEPSIRNQPLCRFPIGFLASRALDLPEGPIPTEILARFPIITFSRGTRPYIAVRQLFSQPHLPKLRLHGCASLSPVIRMAMQGLGIAVIPKAMAHDEMTGGRLRILETEAELQDLIYTASWPMTPDGLAAEAVARIALDVAAEDQRKRGLAADID